MRIFMLVLERLKHVSEWTEDYSCLCRGDPIPPQGEAVVLRVLHEHIKTKKYIKDLSPYLNFLQVLMKVLKDDVVPQGLMESLCQRETLKMDNLLLAPLLTLQHHNSI